MIVLIIALLLFFVNTGVFAANQTPRASTKLSAADIVADIFLLRPAGFIGTILGTAGFVITLPVTLPTKKTDSASKMLIITPFDYTFNRPLGKI
jgi:hypothetical protein